MYQRLCMPDLYIGRTGHLKAFVHEHHISDAPRYLHGLRAVFVADVHVTKRTTQEDLDGLAAKVCALAPDLLLLGGDYADRGGDTVRFFRAFGAVRPPMGTYAVLGNNDAEAWSGRLAELRQVMADAGCGLLYNQAVLLRRGGGSICVAGSDEYLHGKPDLRGILPTTPSPDTYRILLSHYPIAPAGRPDLMLCGHTHGGQFNVMGITPFTVGFERRWGPRFRYLAVSGFHEMDDMHLLVSKGIGASRVQARIGVRPEIDLLIFGPSA